jgi:uncharacterized membrane protein YeaQ/YmgE (transglycosylase-associated protein family)
MQQIWFLIIGLIAGLLTGLLMKGNRSALAGNMIVGVLGAFIGGMIFGALSVSPGMLGSYIAAAVGAVVFLAVVEVMKKI